MPDLSTYLKKEKLAGTGGPVANISFFWPILILIFGMSFSTGYQIVVMHEQLDSLKQAVTELDGKVKQAQHEKTKLYKLASDVLQLSATDSIAKEIVTDYKIQAATSSASASPTK